MEFHISPLEWVVYKHYEVVDGMVQGYGSITNASKYSPFEHLELPNALAKINPEDEGEILEFVHRYGILGGSPDDHGYHQEPEPLEWIQKQVVIIKALMKLVECSKNGDEETAASLCSEDRQTFAGVPITTLLSDIDRRDMSPGLTLNTPLGWVRRIALQIINSHIRGVRRQGVMTADGGVTSAFYFSCMLDTVYWNVLNAMEKSDIGRCEACGTPFIKTDGRQRFCPKQSFEKESRCGMVYHQKQRQLRKKQQA